MPTKNFVDYSPASGNNNGQIDITVPINPEQRQRNSSLSVTGGGITKSINITQKPNMPLGLRSVIGTIGSDKDAKWTYPNIGLYPKDQILLITYASWKTNQNFNDKCFLEFANQKITKIVAKNGTYFTTALYQNDNGVDIVMHDAPMGEEDEFAIYTDHDDASPYLFIKIKIIPYT